MAIEVERQAEYPRMMFADGSLATVYREEYVGNGLSGLILLPEDVAIQRARLMDSMHSNWEASVLMAIEGGKAYSLTIPKASIARLSEDPNGPRWFSTHSILGNRETFNNKDLNAFSDLVAENERLRKLDTDNNVFTEKLRQRCNMLVMELSKKVKTDKELFSQQSLSVDDMMRMSNSKQEIKR